MRRRGIVLTTLVVLMGVGVVGQPPLVLWNPGDPIPPGAGGGPVEVTTSFQISPSFVMWAEGNLDFPTERLMPPPPGYEGWGELARVTHPGYIGWAVANRLYVYWLTNTAIRVTREIWTYKGQGECAKLLPAYTFWRVDRWEEGEWKQKHYVGGWVEANPPVTGYRVDSFDVATCSAGNFVSTTWLYARRDGYNDPEDSYVARVKFTISVL